MAEQAKAITIAGEAAKVDETKSKTALNMAKAQEAAQSNDPREKQQEMVMKQQEHGMKMQESVMKVQIRAETRADQGLGRVQQASVQSGHATAGYPAERGQGPAGSTPQRTEGPSGPGPGRAEAPDDAEASRSEA